MLFNKFETVIILRRTYVSRQILSGLSNQEEWEGRYMGRLWKRGEVRTFFWWINLKERDHVKGLCLAGSIILKRILNKFIERA